MAGQLQYLLVLATVLLATSSAWGARPLNAQQMRQLLQVEDPYTTGVPMVDDEVKTIRSSSSSS
jgi:hypothetical protein